MKKFALIVAGGSGTRMGLDIPKQFAELSGKPILMHTIRVFHRFDKDMLIVLVLPESQKETWEELCKSYSFSIKHLIISGGDERFHSVKNGLEAIHDNGIVFIHDGVRPLVSLETLQRCYDTAIKEGNAIPVVPVSESLRQNVQGTNSSVDRSQYFRVQTPQTFHVSLIKKAYQQDYNPLFTDDASVFEKTGGKINMVDGNVENIKITTPIDLLIAEMMISKRTK